MVLIWILYNIIDNNIRSNFFTGGQKCVFELYGAEKDLHVKPIETIALNYLE